MYDDSASFRACSIFGKNVTIVDIGTQNKYTNDINESPVGKYLNVTSNLVLIGSSKRNCVSCHCN